MTNNIISIIIVFLISSLIGLSVINIVDKRLSDISINMPVVNLPEQKITVQLSDELQNLSGTPSIQGKVVYNSLATLKQKGGNPTDFNDRGGSSGSTDSTMVCKKDLPPARSFYDQKKYMSSTKALPKQSIVVPDPSRDHHSRPAPYPRKKEAMTEPEISPLSTGTYYKNPKEMTQTQLIKFQNKAKLENMTIEDYENWLLTFKEQPEKLAGFHRGNLKILARGGKLDKSDMPHRPQVPHTAQHQYTNIINSSIEDNIPQPEFLGYQPSNYDEQIGSPNNINRNLRHLDYINPDEPLKTWILTQSGQDKGVPQKN